MPRGQIRLNQLHLTKFKISFPFTASTRVVRSAWKKAEINKKWSESMWAKKVEAKKIVSYPIKYFACFYSFIIKLNVTNFIYDEPLLIGIAD